MTVAVVVKVFDGIVVATDSATTLPLQGGSSQVYNNANKIFHLHRNLPIAAMTWGLGNIGSASIATLTKDLRRRLMGQDPDYKSWTLAPDSYTLKEVAVRLVEMFHGELYATEFAQQSDPPQLGMLIAGYSSGQKQAEAWEVLIGSATIQPTPSLLLDIQQYGWQSFAQPQATERLFRGIDTSLAQALEQAVGPKTWKNKVLPTILSAGRQPVAIAMPFADAIDLARFMVSTTAQYSHFLMGPDTVGGTVEVAGINRHEGFRWVSRKHYYSPELNPWGQDHDH